MAARAICLCALFGALLAGSAFAAQIQPRHFPGLPVLSGAGALWVEGGAHGGIAVRSGLPRATPKLVAAFQPENPRAGQYLGATLATSDALALVNTYAFTPMGKLGTSADYTEVAEGPSGGPLQRIARCPGENVSLRSIDVSGGAFVWRQCDGTGGHVEIHDPNGPSRSVGVGGFGARIAGRYVAWLDGTTPYTGSGPVNQTDIVVYDRATGTESYRIPRAALPGPVQSLDVQDDGKIAFSYQVDQRTLREAVGWASPRSPVVHRLPLAARNSYDVHIANDRIAFERGNTNGFVAVQHAEVGLSDLNGGSRLLGRRADDLRYQESFDYNGTRVVWRELACEHPRLVVVPASAGLQPGPPRRCPLKLLSRPGYRHGAATFRFSCGGFQTPCAFLVWLRVPGKHGKHGKLVGKNTNGDGNPVAVGLSRATRHVITRRGHVRLVVTAKLLDSAGRFQTRHTTVTVHQ